MKTLLKSIALVLTLACVGTAASLGPGQVVTIDSTAYSPGQAPFTPVGGVYSDTLPALISTTTAAGRMTAKRALHVNLRDSQGNELGVASNPIQTISTQTITVNFPAVQPVVTTSTINTISTFTVISSTYPVNVNTGLVFPSSFSVTGSTVQANILGSVPVTGTFFQSTQPVSITNLPSVTTVTVNNFPGTQAVSGTVTVGNLPATSTVTFNNVSQPVNLTNIATVTISNVPQVFQSTSGVNASTMTAVVYQLPAASLLSDTVPSATSTVIGAFVSGWSGTNWDRIRTGGDNSDALVPSGVGHVAVLAHNLGFDGTNWNRLRSTIANGLQVDVTRTQGTTYVGFSSAQVTGIHTSTYNVTNIAISSAVVAVASQTVRIFRLIVTVDAATTITFRNGATNFGDQYPLLANGSITLDLSNEPWYVTGSSNAFVIKQSGTANVSYNISYDQS